MILRRIRAVTWTISKVLEKTRTKSRTAVSGRKPTVETPKFRDVERPLLSKAAACLVCCAA